MPLGLRAAIAVAILGLNACTTDGFRTVTLDASDSENKGTSVVTGSRQRLISNVNPGKASRPGLVDPLRIVCTEPSPDVAVAIAKAFGASVDISGKGSANITATQSESLVKLAERTVTVQVIREKMHRACEAYSNGAITGTTYSLEMSRLNDLMVTLVLAELAGGGVGRTPGAVESKAPAEDGAAKLASPDAVKDIKDAASQLVAAEESLKTAEAAYAEASANAKNASDPEKQKTLEGEADKKKTARDKAIKERDAFKALLQDKIEAASKTSSGTTTPTAGGSPGITPNEKVAAVLKDMQGQFLEGDPSFSYVSACLVELGIGNDNSKQDELFHAETVQNFKKEEECARKKGDTEKKCATEEKVDTDNIFLSSALTRKSGLYNLCRDHIIAIINAAQRSKVELRKMALSIESVRASTRDREALTKQVEATEKLVQACSKFTDAATRTQCMNSVVESVRPGPRPAEAKTR